MNQGSRSSFPDVLFLVRLLESDCGEDVVRGLGLAFLFLWSPLPFPLLPSPCLQASFIALEHAPLAAHGLQFSTASTSLGPLSLDT